MKLSEIAKQYNSLYKFNILPLNNKVPQGDWLKWQQEIMNPEDLQSLNWQNANGIGAVCGINDLRCLDFDKVSDPSIVKQFLRSLGLPAAYTWTVLSGSGTGYHIWFCCMNDSYLFKILGGEKSYYKLIPQLLPFSKGEAGRGLCDHIELRWKNCLTVLPPSLHPSGNHYKFLNRQPAVPVPPAVVPLEKLMKTLQKFCVLPKPESKPVKELNKPAVVNLPYIQEAAQYLNGRICNYEDWMRVGFALASIGEQGREFFLTISRGNPEYNDSEESLNKKFSGFIKDYRGDITIRTFYELAGRYGFEKSFDFFWSTEKAKVKIHSNLLIEFLMNNGFAKILVGEDYFFIRDGNNVISIVTKIIIKDFIIQFISGNSEGQIRGLILENLIKNMKILCSESTLECLPTTIPAILMGTKQREYFYFKNGFAEVTAENISFKEYSELKGKVWERQMTLNDFHFTDRLSEFQTFIQNICRHDEERINALRSAIGYLLVSYKDPSCAKAIIFTDEKLSENAFGRSGKGLVAKAISRMRNVVRIDGKNFNFDKAFMFQSVDPDTQLIVFDDVKKKFSFDKLFSILTEGITIEKKNRNEYRLAFENSPKILITTNHSVEGTDDSSLDRQFVVEFSDYYNARHKPKDEFGHLFFDEWDDEQWTSFYNYMLGCCSYYLQNGLKEYEYVNLTRKKLIDSTAPEFEEFIAAVPLNKEFNKKELFEQFRKEYEDFGQIKQNTLSRWTKTYADLYNLDILERKSGTDRFLTFKHKDHDNSPCPF